MVDRPYQARRKRRPHPRRAADLGLLRQSASRSPLRTAQGGLALARRRLVRVKGGRSPAQRTLEARQPALRWLMAGCGAFSHPAMKAKAAYAASHSAGKGRSIFLAMVDRSDQARQNAGPRISIITMHRTGNSRLRR